MVHTLLLVHSISSMLLHPTLIHPHIVMHMVARSWIQHARTRRHGIHTRTIVIHAAMMHRWPWSMSGHMVTMMARIVVHAVMTRGHRGTILWEIRLILMIERGY